MGSCGRSILLRSPRVEFKSHNYTREKNAEEAAEDMGEHFKRSKKNPIPEKGNRAYRPGTIGNQKPVSPCFAPVPKNGMRRRTH